MFQAGGNKKFKDFLETQPDWDDSLPMQQKYNSTAAALYREKVTTLERLYFCLMYLTSICLFIRFKPKLKEALGTNLEQRKQLSKVELLLLRKRLLIQMAALIIIP